MPRLFERTIKLVDHPIDPPRKREDGKAAAESRLAMRLSLWFGVAMLVSKCIGWWITGSSAIFSDAIESIIHVIAVGFAAYSLSLAQRPADHDYRYGYDRIAFFSAGFEGAMIALAGVSIIVTATNQWINGIELQQLGLGAFIVFAASAVNLALGLYLVRTGKKNQSIILVANGKHVLTDSWTSAGVIVGLLLVMGTGWKPFDPICAILVALNILWSGLQLIRQSVFGLMDYAEPEIGRKLSEKLDQVCASLNIQHHRMRYRSTGGKVMMEVHLLFPYTMPLGRAHGLATEVERGMATALAEPLEVVTHLEALEDHSEAHDLLPRVT